MRLSRSVQLHHPECRIATPIQAALLHAVPVAAILALAAAWAAAGSIRHDVPDQQYRDLGNQVQYRPVGAISVTIPGSSTRVGSGTLIGSRWVLTAAHLADHPSTSGINFNVRGTTATNGTNYSAASWTVHTNWNGDLKTGYDLALVRLGTPVPGSGSGSVIPASRYTSTNELGQTATFAGYGAGGDGLTGLNSPYGTKRAGNNVIDTFANNAGHGLVGYSSRIMVVDFDQPGNASKSKWGSTTPLPMEYLIGTGDSGGGVFFQAGSEHRLAGVSSFVLRWDTSEPVGVYGQGAGAIRVSQLNQWIDNTITNYWKTAANGSFGTTGNWEDGYTPTTGDMAGFNKTGTYTVTFGSNVTNDRLLARAGNVTLNLNGRTYTLTSPAHEGAIVAGKYSGDDGRLTFTGGTVNSTAAIVGELASSSGRITVGSGGTWNNSGNVHLGGSTLASGGAGRLDVNGGNVNITGTIKAWNSNSVINYNSGSLSAGRIELLGGARMNLATTGGTKTVNVGTLSIASGSGSRIDLTNNQMRVTGTSLAAVHNLVKTGYNNGAWNGNGITSTTAAAQAGRALGVRPDGGATLVKFTWAGDANLDGKVDIADLSILATNWQQPNRFWYHGDFNFSGVVDIADLSILANNWQKGAGAASEMSFAEALAMFDVFDGVIIPEPSAAVLLALALLGLRRRRSHRMPH